MNADNLITGIISLLILLVFIFNPFLRKLLAGLSGEEEKPPREDPAYGNSGSVARRILGNRDSAPEKAIKFITPEIPVKEPDILSEDDSEGIQKNSLSRLKDLPPLKQAVLWKEILGPPRSLNDKDSLF
ncbi:MAG: hypothetical protein PQJ58_11080 [Spirochaetales bacterium]|nr:hypothetical protein [Spirochaetales bacterium]